MHAYMQQSIISTKHKERILTNKKKNHHPLIFTAPKTNSMIISLQFFDRPT